MKTLREDLRLKDTMESLGFTAQKHVMDKDREGTSNFALAFKKGNKNVWRCSKGWAVAELGDRCIYENHRYYDSLDEVIAKETR